MQNEKVIVFSQPGCPPCRVAEAFLSERGIDFEVRDVSNNFSAVRELVEKYQSRSTPTIVVGDQVMVGFDPQRLEKMLGG